VLVAWGRRFDLIARQGRSAMRPPR